MQASESQRSRGERVIDWKCLPGPRASRRPRLRTRRPELVGGRQPERQQPDGAEVQAAGGNVSLADTGLMAAEPDPQPSVTIERAWGVSRPADDGGQRSADLRRL